MKILIPHPALFLLSALSLGATVGAQTKAPATPPPAVVPKDQPIVPTANPQSATEVVTPDPTATGAMAPEEIQGVIGITTDADFLAKLNELKSAQKINEQTAFEMQLLRAWQARNAAVLKDLANPEKLAAVKYDVTTSQFFSTDAQVKSFLAMLQALVAGLEGDEARVKERSLEAIWLFPEHAAMVGDMIAEFQREQAMSRLTLPMDLAIPTSAGGDVTFRALAAGKKALLLNFWASWAGPSVEYLPTLAQQAEMLLPQGIVTVGINTEGEVKKSEDARTKHKITFPWLVEIKEKPLVDMLEIDSVPRCTLVTPEGKVLYNGHPEDTRLKEALAKLGVNL